MAELQSIAIERLVDHPRNPRIAFRDDVIDGIVANMGEEYPKQHALHVRPVGDNYEIISGHHRKRAAEKRGLSEVWCWVEELSEDDAFMLLATSNSQGELSPLEIGFHALTAVPNSPGGRGKKGGVSKYAKTLGRDQSVITRYRQAAEVLQSCSKPMHWCIGFTSKAAHLAAIHKLGEPAWPIACEWLEKSTESKTDIEERVSTALQFTQPSFSQFFPIAEAQLAMFIGRLTQSQFDRLNDIFGSVADSLDDDLADEWNNWIAGNIGGESWCIDIVQGRRLECEQRQWERDNADKPTDDAPIDVLLADPPWKYEFAETKSRQVENQYPTACADEMATHLELPWVPPIADDCVLFMWTTGPKLQEAFTVLDGWGFTYKTHAVWDKDRMGMGYWFRSQHELLIVATRGKPATPAESDRLPSIFKERRDNKHSKKPECVYKAIESMFPSAAKFEMYQRETRHGWRGGGNES